MNRTKKKRFANIFFSREIFCKKFKNHLQFYMKILLKKIFIFYREISCKFFPKSHFRDHFSKKSPQQCDFENSWVNSPTCLELYSHKKIVGHFFIPMLLLPLTFPLIYLKLKKIEGPRMDSLFFHFPQLHLTSKVDPNFTQKLEFDLLPLFEICRCFTI